VQREVDDAIVELYPAAEAEQAPSDAPTATAAEG
jgi:hypothetical protein